MLDIEIQAQVKLFLFQITLENTRNTQSRAYLIQAWVQAELVLKAALCISTGNNYAQKK